MVSKFRAENDDPVACLDRPAIDLARNNVLLRNVRSKSLILGDFVAPLQQQ